MPTTAFVRDVSPKLADCELTVMDRDPIDVDRARAQHRAYCAALASFGLTIERLPPLPDAPDGVFVEDTAVLVDGVAVITRPGAPSRRHEADSTAEGLKERFDVRRMARGRLDGGDVLQIGKTFWIGLTTRTDRDGIAAFAEIVGPLGYGVEAVAADRCLHLKSAATWAGPEAGGDPVLVYNPAWIDPEVFGSVDRLAVPASEPLAANVLSLPGGLVTSMTGPRTAEALAARGFKVVPVDVSELHKAEAAMTCPSLIG